MKVRHLLPVFCLLLPTLSEAQPTVGKVNAGNGGGVAAAPTIDGGGNSATIVDPNLKADPNLLKDSRTQAPPVTLDQQTADNAVLPDGAARTRVRQAAPVVEEDGARDVRADSPPSTARKEAPPTDAQTAVKSVSLGVEDITQAAKPPSGQPVKEGVVGALLNHLFFGEKKDKADGPSDSGASPRSAEARGGSERTIAVYARASEDLSAAAPGAFTWAQAIKGKVDHREAPASAWAEEKPKVRAKADEAVELAARRLPGWVAGSRTDRERAEVLAKNLKDADELLTERKDRPFMEGRTELAQRVKAAIDPINAKSGTPSRLRVDALPLKDGRWRFEFDGKGKNPSGSTALQMLGTLAFALIDFSQPSYLDLAGPLEDEQAGPAGRLAGAVNLRPRGPASRLEDFWLRARAFFSADRLSDAIGGLVYRFEINPAPLQALGLSGRDPAGTFMIRGPRTTAALRSLPPRRASFSVN